MKFDYSKITARSDAWWAGKSDDILMGAYFTDPNAPHKTVPTQANITDFSLSVAQLADNIVYEAERTEYAGDAYPLFNLDCFGPGALAAYLGANTDNSTGGVWFTAPERELSDLNFVFDENAVYYRRAMELVDAVYERTKGELTMGFPDLGGIIDVYSTFRSGEQMFYDMADDPERMVALIEQITDCWFAAYDKFAEKFSRQKGYSDWARVFSREKAYVIQADACYMFGGAHFDEFVLPFIRAQTERLPRTLYHLDGVGELIHLDKLLALENLNAVQWVCGAGKDVTEWTDVYKKILDSGKGLQIQYSSIDEIDTIVQRIGATRNIATFPIFADMKDKDAVLKRMEKIREGR